MSRKIKFVVPTVFARKETEITCVENICHQALKHNVENEVHMVCNFESIEFDQWIPEHPQIQKHVSHLMHSISKALNVESINNTLKIDVYKLINDTLNA